MIEGNGHDTPEAGPSGWPLRGQRSNGELRRRSSDAITGRRASSSSSHWDTSHEVKRTTYDREARGSFRKNDNFDLDLPGPSRLTPPRPAHYFPTPPPDGDDEYQEVKDLNYEPQSWSTLATPLGPGQSSGADYFHTPMMDDQELDRIALPHMPTLTRQTTYSSLPPSPRYEDYDLGGKIDAKDFEEALGRLGVKGALRRASLSAGAVPRVVGDADGNSFVASKDRNEPQPEEKSSSEGLSMWDLLRDESEMEDWDGWIVEGKWERIANFLAVPLAVEKVTLFGALLCLDGFLYNFTILPIRSIFATTRIASNGLAGRSIWPIPPTHILSILRMLLLFIPTVILLAATDASKMYHTVRGQDTIKLYVIFNALEIADRLCCAFGQDVLDTLFARETLAPTSKKLPGKGRKRQQARPYFFFALSLGYVLVHTLIYFYMLVSLNVAINSYDYTLLSLLISNQFVEIKGSVFKKFEKENLFQIMCADIVERFQLALMLSVIALRNMIEMAGSDIAFLPKSFIRGKSIVDSILSPVLFVIISEMVVDWLKHAFITKFNHVRASVYGRFTDVLAKDVLLAGSMTRRTGSRSNSKGKGHPILLDQSPLVARRLGFASIPLACLVIRIGVQAVGMLTSSSHHDDAASLDGEEIAWIVLRWTAGIGIGLSAWGCLVALKILLGLSLLSYSALRQAGMKEREAEDAVNDFGRTAVGERKEEAEYNKQTSEYLSKSEDDLPYTSPTTARSRVPLPHTASRPTNFNDSESLETTGVDEKPKGEGKHKGKKWKLEEVERWTMVKRIW